MLSSDLNAVLGIIYKQPQESGICDCEHLKKLEPQSFFEKPSIKV